MGLFDRLGSMFGKKKPTLAQVPLDDLKREQIGLQNELRKLENESDKLEREEKQLLEDYKAAHLARRASGKRAIAQKLQNQAMRRKGIDTRLSYTNKMFQTVTGMLTIKENMEFFKRIGVGSIISDMDLGELQSYIAEATIEGTLHQEKLATILQGVSEGVDQLIGASQDSGLDDFMADLDATLLGTKPAQETAAPQETFDMDALNAVVDKGIAAAREIQQHAPPERQDRERNG